jgi:hypothetical protein
MRVCSTGRGFVNLVEEQLRHLGPIFFGGEHLEESGEVSACRSEPSPQKSLKAMGRPCVDGGHLQDLLVRYSRDPQILKSSRASLRVICSC